MVHPPIALPAHREAERIDAGTRQRIEYARIEYASIAPVQVECAYEGWILCIRIYILIATW